MLISFSTSFLVAFIRQFPVNYSCNIIVPSLVLLLCQLFTFTYNMRYCFSFLVTHSKKVVIGLFYLSCVSHSLFELPVLVWHTTWLPFQLSSKLYFASSIFLFHLLFLAFLLKTHSFLQGWKPPFSEGTPLSGYPFFWSKFKKLPPSFWEPCKLVDGNCKKHFKMKVLRFVLY